jgi:hypothetical protein
MKTYGFQDYLAGVPFPSSKPEAGSPQSKGFNYGTGWPSGERPSFYFDGVKLQAEVQDQAHLLSSVAWALSEALRNVRLAETPAQREMASKALRDCLATLDTARTAQSQRETVLLGLITRLESEIEQHMPRTDKGPYVPHFGMLHIMTGLRRIVSGIKLALGLHFLINSLRK